jgi:hypothetical protein
MPRNLAQAAREFYESAVKEDILTRYRAHLNNEEFQNELLQEYQLRWKKWRENQPGLPDEVYAAHLFYVQHFTDQDIGSDRVFKFPVNGKDVYAVRTRTDGDDTWIELYDCKGKFLAAARTHLDVVAWGDRDWLRAQVAQTGEYPPELEGAFSRSLWGQPLEGFHCRETRKHACTASPAGCCIERAGHLQADHSPHRCSQCGFTWGGQPRPPAPPPPPKREVVPWVVRIYFRTERGSYVYSMNDLPITLVTEDGTETIPVTDIQQIDFAPRNPDTGAIKGRRADVIHIAEGKRSGTLQGGPLLTYYPGAAEQKFWFTNMKKLIALTRQQARDYFTFGDPGTLITESRNFGIKRRHRLVGSDEGPVFGTDLYALNSSLATAAVHAGRVAVGKKGIVEVEIIPSPKRFKGSTRNGITSESAAEYSSGAFRFVDPEED